MTIIIVFALLATVCIFMSGILAEDSAGGSTIFAIFGVFCLILMTGSADVYYSPITKSLSGNYVVEERFASKEKGNLAILYSVKEDRERIAELKDWPPTGYSETQIEGKLMLIPTPSK